MASLLSDTDAGSHVNGHNLDDDHGHSRKPSLGLSEYEGEDDNVGDYSTRMEELFEEDDGDEETGEDDDDEEGFLYTGVDANDSTGDYCSQLRDVLGPEAGEDQTEELEIERSLLHDAENEEVQFNPHDLQVCIARVIRPNVYVLTVTQCWLYSMVMLPLRVHRPHRPCMHPYF